MTVAATLRVTPASCLTHHEHMQRTLLPRCHALLGGKVWLQELGKNFSRAAKHQGWPVP